MSSDTTEVASLNDLVQPQLSSADIDKSSGGCKSGSWLCTPLVCLAVHSNNLSRCSASSWKGKTTCWQQSQLHPDCNHMDQWSVSPHHDWFNARTLKHSNTAPLFGLRWLFRTMLPPVKNSSVFLCFSKRKFLNCMTESRASFKVKGKMKDKCGTSEKMLQSPFK